MKIFNLPDLGEGLPDAEIVEWYVKAGDEVSEGDKLVAMETAKAIIDIPSPNSGFIGKLFGRESDVIITGKPLIGFVDQAEDVSAESAPRATDSGTVVGEMESNEGVIAEQAIGLQHSTAAISIIVLRMVSSYS